MATARTPRSAWIDAARDALGEGGPEAVRVEVLATRLGVTKGGFYWHFTDRQALLDEVLDTWEQTTVDDVITRVREGAADARAQLRRFFAEVAPSTNIVDELAIRNWARRDDAVAARLRRVDDRRMAWMRSVFAEFCADEDEAVGRSMLAYSLLIGSYFIVARLDGRGQGDLVRLAVDSLLA